MKNIKTGDPVIVIAGKHKWKVSKVEKINMENDMVYVKGVNIAKKAVKWKGFIEKTLPIHISNVMYYVESKKKGTKINIEISDKNRKKRISNKFKDIKID